ncbi:GGDEF domain-containing protein [Sulfurimonas sp.]|uniref:GGDEF domain-containing protein n=1 Tax=Sulfurimonas sp. TaxID=2022749 RepID=UPI00260813BC|nr:GGDEF domain-containing protein [Sulfurimonas sp.]
MNKEQTLHIISNEAKSSIDALSIVTPSIYASIFKKYAQEHNTDLKDEEELASNLLQKECSNFITLQDTTSKNINTLDSSTKKAIHAIQSKDDTVLNEVLKETQALRQEIEHLKASIYSDELTKAFNRRWLHHHYLQSDEKKFKCDGVLAIIDLNYFKQINDTLGHITGDKVLIFITNALKKSKEPVIRYGGDEFIIMFDKFTSEQDAREILNTIRENILKSKLKAHNSTFRVSFSIGLTSFKTDHILTETIETADKDMYQDKIEIKKRVTGIEI